MSHQPPYGPPPPYGGYPPPPGVAFVPAPVMMPIYPPTAAPAPPPSHPTYVTNHYYPPEQAPPQPTPAPMPVQGPQQVYQPSHSHDDNPVQHLKAFFKSLFKPRNDYEYCSNDVDWVTVTPTSATQYSHRAFVAGKEGWDGSPLWAIRAHYNGEFVPGKFAAKHGAAYIPHQGKEIPVHNFEVLLAKPHVVRWVHSSNGQVPPGAIAAGNTHTGEPLYTARVHYQNSITPGKVHPSHQCAYISFGGNEMSFKQYEVLCKVQGHASAYLR